MSSSNKTLSLLTATALAAGLGMTASASALSMSDLAQGYLVAGQAAKASTDAKAADTKMAADATKHAEGKCGADGKAAKASVVPTRAAAGAAGAKAKTGDTKSAEGKCGEGKCGGKHDVGARLVHPQSPLVRRLQGWACAGRCCRICVMPRQATSTSSNARRRTGSMSADLPVMHWPNWRSAIH